jgi:starvation-inducible DNA-binding protein
LPIGSPLSANWRVRPSMSPMKRATKDTADLFTGVSRQIDKDLWFVEAHLQ